MSVVVAQAAPLAGSENLRSRIYEDMREKLRRGQIGPRDRLIDVDIAKSLGVSRMPVREALLRLISEGHLVGTTRGFVLPELTSDDVRDIFEVRKLLEPRAAAHAARDRTEADLAAMNKALTVASAAMADNDFEAYIDATVTFRTIWVGAIRNRRLAETIDRFADQTQIVRYATLMDRETRAFVLGGLKEIFDAFCRSDTIAAQDRVAAFIAASERSYAGSLASTSKSGGPEDGQEQNTAMEKSAHV